MSDLTTVTLLVELTYDQGVMHHSDPEAVEWFNNEVLGDPGLLLHSNEICNTIGTVRVIGRPTPPASHDAVESFRPDWTDYRQGVADGKADAADTIATLTAEVSRLTGELDAASARLHEVATLCATVEQGRDRLTAELEEVREQRNRIAATMTGELEKETAHSKHLAGAVSHKIEELIAVENQCGYYRMQYSRAEKIRKEACEANVKARAAMLWLEADLERSLKECEGLREAIEHYEDALLAECPDGATGWTFVSWNRARAALSQPGKGE